MDEKAKRPSLRERMAVLRGRFLERAVSQIRRAETLLELLADDPGAIYELKVLMHTLKGSAATFEGEALSELARQCEDLILRNAGGRQLADALRPKIAAMPPALQDMAGAHWVPSDVCLPELAQQARGRLVYLCEDDKTVAEQLCAQLTCFGYQCVTFSNLTALCQGLEHQRPDALIMDIVLPEGEDATFKLVQDLSAGSEPVPTIFLSSLRSFGIRLRAVRAGGRGYVTKPVSLVELVQHLDEMTGRTVPEPCRVLIVDDQPEVADYHSLILERAGMSVRTVHEPMQVLDVIEEFHPDLVLMDMYMPRCNGRELAAVIRQIPQFIGMPIVYLSSETDADRQTFALVAGADGFLVKPIDPAQLIAQVAIRAERMRGLRALMVRDSLTGLLNHNALKDFLDNEIAGARRNGGKLCFAMIDVDNFKAINDGHGHPVGDQVLIGLARLLHQKLRGSDMVGRYGGEEFGAVLTNVGEAEAARVLDALRADFAKLRFHTGCADISASFSVGLAEFPAWGSAQELCDAADRALYQAKRAGRNRVVAASTVAELQS